MVQFYAPQAYFVFHDSFHPDAPEWLVLFEDYTKVAMDHHGYMAFSDYSGNDTQAICDHYDRDNAQLGTVSSKFEVWQGEWAFATDNCAHWLLGFNIRTQGNQTKCSQVPCPKLYFDCPSKNKFDCEVDPSVARNGPFSPPFDNAAILVENGMCWSDNNETLNATGLQHVANCTVQVIDKYYNSSFMWTARNQIETKWSYLWAYDMGWFKAKANPAVPVD